MSGTFTVDGSNTTIKFEYSATTSRVVNIIDNAVHYLWSRGRGDQSANYADLTNQDKLDILDAYLKDNVVDLAKTNYINTASDAARVTAITEADTNFLLGG